MRIRSLLTLGSMAAFAAACSDSSGPTPAKNAGEFTLELSASAALGAPAVKIMPIRGQQPVNPNAGPPILYHPGAQSKVIPSPKVAAVYWGTSTIYAGGPTPGSGGTGAGDGSVVGAFMRTMGGTPFWNINNDYTDNIAPGHRVANSLQYTQFYANNQNPGAAPNNAAIQTMLQALFANGSLTFDQQTIYAVFTASGVNLNGGFGSQYCAYHGYFPWTGHPGKFIIYAAMPYDAQFPGACTAVNTAGHSPNGDFAADAVINVLSHELEEASTDPGLNAWFDGLGQENADKCAWTFTPTFNSANASQANVTFAGKDYLIQRNWKIGPNLTNQLGCGLS